jgi:hypothetical protein
VYISDKTPRAIKSFAAVGINIKDLFVIEPAPFADQVRYLSGCATLSLSERRFVINMYISFKKLLIMNTSRINLIAYRIVGSIIIILLLLAGGGMILDDSYLKGGINITAAIIIGWRLFKLPSMIEWATVVMVLFVALIIIGYLPN